MNGPWRVIVPVKGTDRAKSRLAVRNNLERSRLARSMALDTLAAVLACPLVGAVVVVTSDPEMARAAEDLGAFVVPDPGAGLNAAITSAASHDTDPAPGSGPTAALLADVPALTSEELAVALRLCQEHPSAFVPDAEGAGTVLLTALRVELLHPAFGPDSAARHEQTSIRLDLDLPGLRRDVDTVESLADAVALGVGDLTRAAWAAAGPHAAEYSGGVQGSVHRFDPASGSGSVLLDDGVELPFDGQVFGQSGLRLLRIGQRVSLEVADQRIVELHLFGI